MVQNVFFCAVTMQFFYSVEWGSSVTVYDSDPPNKFSNHWSSKFMIAEAVIIP